MSKGFLVSIDLLGSVVRYSWISAGESTQLQA
jgi:hypothetical protein